MKKMSAIFFIGICMTSLSNSASFESIIANAMMPASNESRFYLETQDPVLLLTTNETRCFAFSKDEDDYCETSGFFGVPQWSSGGLFGELAYTSNFYPKSDNGEHVNFYSNEDAVCSMTIDGEHLDTSVAWRDYGNTRTHFCIINETSLDLFLSTYGTNKKVITRTGNPKNINEQIYRLSEDLEYSWSYLLLHHSAISNERTVYKPFWTAVRLVASSKPKHLWKYTVDRIKVWLKGPLTKEEAKKIMCERGTKYYC